MWKNTRRRQCIHNFFIVSLDLEFLLLEHKIHLLYTYGIEWIASKTTTKLSSSNHNSETTFSHVGKAFHPIRNQLSKWISQFASRLCSRAFSIFIHRSLESFHNFTLVSRELAINQGQCRKLKTGLSRIWLRKKGVTLLISTYLEMTRDKEINFLQAWDRVE